MPLGLPLPLATFVPQGNSVGFGFVPTPLKTDTMNIASMPFRYVKYRLTQENFAKMVRSQKKFKWKLNIWVKEFKTFMDRVVTEALKSYENLHMWMDDIEERVNERLI